MNARLSPEAWTFLGVCVTAVCGLLGGLIVAVRGGRSENSADHALVREALHTLQDEVSAGRADVRDLRSDVKDIGRLVDGHIEWHLDQKGDT